MFVLGKVCKSNIIAVMLVDKSDNAIYSVEIFSRSRIRALARKVARQFVKKGIYDGLIVKYIVLAVTAVYLYKFGNQSFQIVKFAFVVVGGRIAIEKQLFAFADDSLRVDLQRYEITSGIAFQTMYRIFVNQY